MTNCMDTWAELCRCCLSPDTKVSLYSDSNIKNKFIELTSIQITSDDGLPQKICENCLSNLNGAYDFRNRCIKMDSELKMQLEVLNEANNTFEKFKKEETLEDFDLDEIGNDPVKQLESVIKKEPSDSDDDCYYVLVIDDPSGNNGENKTASIKSEPPSIEEKYDNITTTSSQQDFHVESFSVSETKVPVNVPATILENEESLETDEFINSINVEETQSSDSQEQIILPESQHNMENIVQTITGEVVKSSDGKTNILKILSTDGTQTQILVKNNDQIAFLADDIITNNDDENDDLNSQEQIIYCEGEEDSQFQILKCAGSELVIEYAKESQLATVLQQEDCTFLCECGQQFKNISEFENHQHDTHNSDSEHSCNLCGKSFESVETLTGHTLLHNVPGALIMCPFCQQLIKRSVLTPHIKYTHSNIKPSCSICSRTFANPNNLKRHMMIHTGVKEFECDICFKRFHQKITMQTHRITHMNPFTCNECNARFDDKAELISHKDSTDCGKTKVVKVKEELMKTIKQEITTKLGKLLGYACSLCNKMFSVESSLDQHIENVHIIDPMELLCGSCGAVLPSKKQMQAHMLAHKNMKIKNAKRFECSVCGKGCASQAMLVMHERVHTNERPFACHLCSLRFKTKTHLRTHQLTHTREKKFGCSVCMKFFALKGNLVVHLRTHTGERPYVCSLCGEAFIDSKYLKKHKLKKHSIDNVPWDKY